MLNKFRRLSLGSASAPSGGRQDLPLAGSQGWDGRCRSSHSQDRRRSADEHEDWYDDVYSDDCRALSKRMNLCSCCCKGGEGASFSEQTFMMYQIQYSPPNKYYDITFSASLAHFCTFMHIYATHRAHKCFKINLDVTERTLDWLPGGNFLFLSPQVVGITVI